MPSPAKEKNALESTARPAHEKFKEMFADLGSVAPSDVLVKEKSVSEYMAEQMQND